MTMQSHADNCVLETQAAMPFSCGLDPTYFLDVHFVPLLHAPPLGKLSSRPSPNLHALSDFCLFPLSILQLEHLSYPQFSAV